MNKLGNICIFCIKEFLYYALVAGIMIYAYKVTYNLDQEKNIKKGYEESYYALLNTLPKCKYKEEVKEINRVDITGINYSIKEDKLCKS